MKNIRKFLALLLVLTFLTPAAAFADEGDPAPGEEPPATEEGTQPPEESPEETEDPAVTSPYDEFLGDIGEDSELYPIKQLMEQLQYEISTDDEGLSTLIVSFVNPEIFEDSSISEETLAELETTLREKIEQYLSHPEEDADEAPTEDPEVIPDEAPTEDPADENNDQGTEDGTGDEGTADEGTEDGTGDEGTADEGTEDGTGDEGTADEGTEDGTGDEGTADEGTADEGTEDGTGGEGDEAAEEAPALETFTIEIELGYDLTEEQIADILNIAESAFGGSFITESFENVKDEFFQAKVDYIEAVNAYKEARKTGDQELIDEAYEALVAAREYKDAMEALKDEVELLKDGIKELIGEDEGLGKGPKEESPSVMNKLESNGIGKGLVKVKTEKQEKVKSNNGKKD